MKRIISFHLLDPPPRHTSIHHPFNSTQLYITADHCSVPLISITQLHPSCTASSKCLKKIVPVSVRRRQPSSPPPHLSRETAAIMRPGLVCAPPGAYTPGYRKRGVRGYLFRAGRATGAEENARRERERDGDKEGGGRRVCNSGEMLHDTIVPREKHASTRFHSPPFVSPVIVGIPMG